MRPLTEVEAHQHLAGSVLGHLAVVVDGRPQVFPVFFVVDGPRLLFLASPTLLEAVRVTPEVALEVCRLDEGRPGFWRVVVEGRASEVKDGRMEYWAAALLLAKYPRLLGVAGVGFDLFPGRPSIIKLAIERIAGSCSEAASAAA